ncbi:sensor histidine kinase [Desulfonema magnum]|uniref:histidine kinase n=1 Tax=Desulfonema magnum TaxID=45655 RepID=A0A975BVC5_9BACT|nr:PAS domain-containing sensor histidine kinase [Desulfonema magnum]QTA92303.1 Two component system histidine kinase, double Cache domain-containing [Desulfonema magnum]
MSLQERLKPKFWEEGNLAETRHRHMFNFPRIWKKTVLITAGVALIPLILLAIVDYQVTQSSVESENLLRTSRLVSNTRRRVSFFLFERRSALDFIIHDNSFESLMDSKRLAAILEHLKKTIGGFSDLGVIDAKGIQRTYVGPYPSKDIDYSKQEWFREVRDWGMYVSDVFMGYRNFPHLVIAVKHDLADGSFYVLRASLSIEQFNDLFSQLEVGGKGDAFIINGEGILQTPSLYNGNVLEKIHIPVPMYSERTQVLETLGTDDEPILVGYAYIQETPFILMVIKQKNELMGSWYDTRMKLVGFLIASITTIIVVILCVVTYLVSSLYMADQKRMIALHHAEHSDKMASVGRLAAGVAHEINNPLAIINEKAGLIKDIFTFKKEYKEDQKLRETVESIISSVERCGTITKRLLNFARHVDMNIQLLRPHEVIREVLGFLNKEANYRSIQVALDVDEDIPPFESDKGKLQQIFLNLLTNAFSALDDGGLLNIAVKRKNTHFVCATFADDGCGIPRADLERIFEPFFTTRAKEGGTGLGLSITYGLVQELGGKIEVQSEIGKGTTFTVTLPLRYSD